MRTSLCDKSALTLACVNGCVAVGLTNPRDLTFHALVLQEMMPSAYLFNETWRAFIIVGAFDGLVVPRTTWDILFCIYLWTDRNAKDRPKRDHKSENF